MARVKRGTTVKQKHNKILARAKGYLGRHHSTYRAAREKTEKAGQYAYRDRRVKKREFRGLWIVRINAAVRANGMTYSQLDRKSTRLNSSHPSSSRMPSSA